MFTSSPNPQIEWCTFIYVMTVYVFVGSTCFSAICLTTKPSYDSQAELAIRMQKKPRDTYINNYNIIQPILKHIKDHA